MFKALLVERDDEDKTSAGVTEIAEVKLLDIDSVMQPYENRLRAWQRIARDLPMDKLESMIQPATLANLPKVGADLLKGQAKGRIVVDVTA